MDFLSMHYGHHCVPGWKWSVQAAGHPGFTLWSIWGGSGQMMLGETLYPLHAGDIFFINYRAHVIAFQNDGDHLDVRYIDFTLQNPYALEDLPEHCHIKHYHFVSELFSRFYQAEEKCDIDQMKVWLNALLFEYRNNPERVGTGIYSKEIDDLCSLFQQYPGKQYSIHKLAHDFALSTDHFIRIFKQEKGSTPYTYLQMVRLEYAKGLLCMSDINITDIAAACGFSNVYEFSRFFRQKAGCTPSEYRER